MKRRNIIKCGLAAPFIVPSRARAWTLPGARMLKPTGTPFYIDWSQGFTNGLVGLWDLGQPFPVDITGNTNGPGLTGALTSGAGGNTIQTPFGTGRQNVLATPNGGAWVTTSSIPINNSVAMSMLNIGYIPGNARLSTFLASVGQSTGSGNYIGIDMNSSNLGYPANLNPHIQTPNNNGGLISGTSFNPGSTFHSLMTCRMDGGASSNLNHYTNGVLDGTSPMVSDTFAAFDTMSVGCWIQPPNSNPTGTFTNGSPVFTTASSLASRNVNALISGTGIPGGAYILPTNFNSPLKSYTMSAPYTGTSGSVSITLSGSLATGTVATNLCAIWNRDLSASEAAALYASGFGWIIWNNDIHGFF